MNQKITQKGAIYFRDNEWYKTENVVKMGVSSSLIDRSNTYITGEIIRGEYIYVIEIPLDKINIIDKMTKNYFKQYNIYKGGGTEFYNICIIELIEPYLKQTKLDYRVLTTDEINLLNRTIKIRNIPNLNKVKQFINQISIKTISEKYREKNNTIIKNEIIPNKQQQYVLDIIENFFQINEIGKIIWACGLGKALLSILIIKLLNFKLIVFGVPSIQLQKQIINEILKIYDNKNNILLVGGNERSEIKTTTDKEQIIQFTKNTNNTTFPKFVITTYHSCYLLANADIIFDFKIGDEAHHLVGVEKEENRGFRLFHKIKSTKTLFMTATEKTVENRELGTTTNTQNADNNKEIYCMDDDAIFGKYIDIKTVHWAIENKKITDYHILVLKNTQEEVNKIVCRLGLDIDNREIFISCYMCLKSFETYDNLTHLLLYTNTTDDAELSKKYIDEILQLNVLKISKERVYNNALHSKNCCNLNDEVSNFKDALFGIISCVYIFGEGFDLPKLNGVCIVGNMQSETRIVQYVLRPNRLDYQHPNKIAYIIIPYIDAEDWETETKSYEKVRNIVYQMRNVDENIEQKMSVSVFSGDDDEIDDENEEKQRKENDDKTMRYENFKFKENENELNKLKIRLRYSKVLSSNFTEEQDEYNYVRSVNSSLGVSSKQEYNDIQNIHRHFVEFPEEYFRKKGVWNGWYNFMGVDTAKFIQSKEDWINFCRELGIETIEDYFKSCQEYDILPKEPAEFYREFTSIPSELRIGKTRRK